MGLRGVHDVSRSPEVVTDEIFISPGGGKGTPRHNPQTEVIV